MGLRLKPRDVNCNSNSFTVAEFSFNLFNWVAQVYILKLSNFIVFTSNNRGSTFHFSLCIVTILIYIDQKKIKWVQFSRKRLRLIKMRLFIYESNRYLLSALKESALQTVLLFCYLIWHINALRNLVYCFRKSLRYLYEFYMSSLIFFLYANLKLQINLKKVQCHSWGVLSRQVKMPSQYSLSSYFIN